MAATTTNSSTPPPPIRRPYHGSCHCGRIRYVAFFSLPPVALLPDCKTSARFYKCNCSPCQKMGIFHLRVADPPSDFYLLSPQDVSSMSDYQCNRGTIHWYFCSNCGVRCLSFRGEGEVVEVDLKAALGGSEGKLTKVWRCKERGWFQLGKTNYLSINAHTIEPGQEGFDLRELVDKKWVEYLDRKDDIGEDRYDYPHNGGTW